MAEDDVDDLLQPRLDKPAAGVGSLFGWFVIPSFFSYGGVLLGILNPTSSRFTYSYPGFTGRLIR
jgi:hypothetical protein